MKTDGKSAAKSDYQRLRLLSWQQLWTGEVSRFDKALPEQRSAMAAVVRAVGVVFAESGPAMQQQEVRQWLCRLLRDPGERIRRYAMAALPKIGAGDAAEAALIELLRKTPLERERRHLERSLEKIGGAATLAVLPEVGLHLRTEQKILAGIARSRNPGGIRLDQRLEDFSGLRLHLRGRCGFENILCEELRESAGRGGPFRIAGHSPGLVAISSVAPFSLADLYRLRCFATAGFVLGEVPPSATGAAGLEAVAQAIAAPLSQRLVEALTEGAIRYRLDFVGNGHQRGAVRQVAAMAYAASPAMLNDARKAPWTVQVHAGVHGDWVELVPRLAPDPRLSFREADIPASSSPQLAACMARLAGRTENEIVWDPFCGSGLELIERAILGGVSRVYGTDCNPEAIAKASRNFAAAQFPTVPATFACGDFRDFAQTAGLGPGTVTLILSNPPMGRRIPVRDLQLLITDFLKVAATVLRPGGRLVFANPLSTETMHPLLELLSRQVVDFGGFNCRLDKFRKPAR